MIIFDIGIGFVCQQQFHYIFVATSSHAWVQRRHAIVILGIDIGACWHSSNFTTSL